MRIACPYCGPRDEHEFTWGGEGHLRRPDPARADDAAWAAYLFLRHNPAGPAAERWCHTCGCGQWFHVLRDTVTHRIERVYGIAVTPAEAGGAVTVTPAKADVAVAVTPAKAGVQRLETLDPGLRRDDDRRETLDPGLRRDDDRRETLDSGLRLHDERLETDSGLRRNDDDGR